MAFILQNFGLSSVTFNQYGVATNGDPIGSPRSFSYQSTSDTLSTISTLDYFSAKSFDLNVGDLIYCVGTDGSSLYRVSAVVQFPNSVTLVPAISVLDSRVLQYSRVPFTAAQFKSIGLVPVVAVKSPGDNTLIYVERALLFLKYGTVAYLNGSALGLQYADAAHPEDGNEASNTINAADVRLATEDTYFTVETLEGTTLSAGSTGLDLVFVCENTEYTTGDSNFVLHTWYSIIDMTYP